ncbi:hypothetical protein PUNSTDRAFT_71957, partial [Punctularia strigosozonata HHB-11173 SS5]|uniref:uncharacterized protein n=1 Tax=Punctularia strigosozonata (strain HHB-11173) TaxID=741275 RepID=UPI000441861E
TGQITLDNASNCGTMMAELERKFTVVNIPFHRDGNRVRLPDDTDPAVRKEWERYRDALSGDPLGRTRKLVGDCRSSGQRRAGLQHSIHEGNRTKSWPQRAFDEGSMADDLQTGGELPEVQLLRDCETRWSATFLMIFRLLVLYPAVARFFIENELDLAHLLDEHERRVLRDIYLILRYPHAAQEILSAEKTPTLSLALPCYELLIDGWEDLRTQLPHLITYINVGISKLKEYLLYSRRSRIYALAMILNPGMKLEWINEHWTANESAQARSWMIDAMLEYCRESRRASAPTSKNAEPLRRSSSLSDSITNSAVAAQTRGFNRLLNLSKRPASSRGSPTMSCLSLFSSSSSPSPLPSAADLEQQEETCRRQDKSLVEEEMRRYEQLGVTTSDLERSTTSDLITFWDAHQNAFPHLFKVALDVLPVQASAVPSLLVTTVVKRTHSFVVFTLYIRPLNFLDIIHPPSAMT